MKEKIIEQSIRLFGQNGFTETSIQDIVNSLGVTKGTFYYYFTSKEELLMEIHLRFIEDILTKQKQIIEEPTKDCKAKLHDIVYMLIHNIESQGQSARIFFREIQNLSEHHLAQIFPKRDQFRDQLQELLCEGIKQGEFRSDLNVKVVSLAILGACNWSYHWFRPDGPLPDVEIASIYIDLFLNGVVENN
ncbi:TetR/AcrR family transcriptional regulator [Desertibacillus haloalkaliphilus]|uniref:TetR/AcrR family transcriptional regulator n=1 Tax=Desertibacillus haloalkaliphilus TaxID=1328930 RepID=UPI001C262DCA|nr:TetR/AcrR family transcriptional regulator [Desertibacillus haloalkaliphilus]MBU8905644.1 TetR/AcrR family transcriptional regulator [Desertibacillus haloalkaliphilus]